MISPKKNKKLNKSNNIHIVQMYIFAAAVSVIGSVVVAVVVVVVCMSIFRLCYD